MFSVMVRAIGFQGQPLVKIDFWPEFSEIHDKIQKGDFVVVDGKYSQGSSNDGSKVYHNLSASKLFLNGELVEPAEQERRAAPARSQGNKAPF